MTENFISFYKLKSTSFEKALPKLLEKILEKGQKSLVRTQENIDLNLLSKALWIYHPSGFLPHGFEKKSWTERWTMLITHNTTHEGVNQKEQPEEYPLNHPLWLTQDHSSFPKEFLENSENLQEFFEKIQKHHPNNCTMNLEKLYDFLNPNKSENLVSFEIFYPLDHSLFQKILVFFDGCSEKSCANAQKNFDLFFKIKNFSLCQKENASKAWEQNTNASWTSKILDSDFFSPFFLAQDKKW